MQRDVAVLILLVLISTGIIILDRVSSDISVVGILSRPFAPFLKLSARVMALSSLETENRLLRSNLMTKSEDNARLREQVHEIDRLRDLVDFRRAHRGSLRVATVVLEIESRLGGGIVLDGGTDRGFEENMTVISPDGLVGRVVRVRKNASLVKRIVDPGYRVSALTLRTRASGILGRDNTGKLIMEWVSPNAEIAPGDTVISSGLGSVTPKGILIGEVAAIQARPESFSQSLRVEPFVDFGRLEEVFIIMDQPPDYRAIIEGQDDER
jgi:rod shape-determining protein MreC